MNVLNSHANVSLIGAVITGLWMVIANSGFASDERFDAATVQKVRTHAEQGDAEAQALLGLIYDEGHGVKENDAEAARWYRKAAEQGNPPAQMILGGLYLEGRGVSPNPAEGSRWIRRAAEQDDSTAQLLLGSLYMIGNGLEKNYTLAYMWLALARANGVEDAPEGLALLNQLMSAEEIADAEKLAAEWRQARPPASSD